MIAQKNRGDQGALAITIERNVDITCFNEQGGRLVLNIATI
jgi:hypothetical protein